MATSRKRRRLTATATIRLIQQAASEAATMTPEGRRLGELLEHARAEVYEDELGPAIEFTGDESFPAVWRPAAGSSLRSATRETGNEVNSDGEPDDPAD